MSLDYPCCPLLSRALLSYCIFSDWGLFCMYGYVYYLAHLCTYKRFKGLSKLQVMYQTILRYECLLCLYS